ncbi:MAG: OmpA family protein [Chitinophagales bacterium]|nr:OmpA family protein [Chitinophagales bacterium]
MRNVSKILCMTVLMTCFILENMYAQSSKRPWMINGGANVIDFNAANKTDGAGGLSEPGGFSDFFKTENWNTLPAIAKLTIARSLNPSLALDLQLGGARITKLFENTTSARAFADGDLNLRYKFDNGYIIHENSWFAPYIFVGGGGTYLDNTDKDVRPHIDGGVGFNFWFWKDVGFFVQSSYKWIAGGDKDVIGKQSYLNHSAGVAVRFGKKDTDKDGIEDDADACPTEPGPASTMGCPDADGDGIPDKTDACPNQAGPASLSGCPDSDGDGVADKDDRCPNAAGSVDMKGCPDRDADLVADIDDQCPDQKGLAEFQGCPDTDGDGVPDKQDACPTQKGLAQFQGCPDTDGDGVPDTKDHCPNQAGPASNAGCPLPPPEVIQKINLSAKSIQFQTGKDIITKLSYPVLDIIAEIMQQYPDTKWEIDGHTDNVGNDVKNMDLSDRRAASVKNYFIGKGVNSDRLSSHGFGETTPIADNKTSAGRAKNRRVEIKLMNQQ